MGFTHVSPPAQGPGLWEVKAMNFPGRTGSALRIQWLRRKRRLNDEVEAIVSARGSGGGREYLVKWDGHPKSAATWEPAANCANCRVLVVEFEKKEKAAVLRRNTQEVAGAQQPNPAKKDARNRAVPARPAAHRPAANSRPFASRRGAELVPTNRAPVEGEPYAIGTRLTAAYRKHVCEENDSIVSVVEGIEDPLVHRDLLRAQMLAVNRRLLLGPKLRAKSLLKAGTILLIPDAACKLHSTVTKYLGFFDAGDVHSERWEATDGDDLIYKVDASNVYEGMGYSTDPDGAYMGERVVRRFENGGESDGVVVGRMAAGQAADEPAVWLVLHNDGDREDLEKHELEEAIALAKQEVPAAKKQRALPADEEELQSESGTQSDRGAASAAGQEDGENLTSCPLTRKTRPHDGWTAEEEDILQMTIDARVPPKSASAWDDFAAVYNAASHSRRRTGGSLKQRLIKLRKATELNRLEAGAVEAELQPVGARVRTNLASKKQADVQAAALDEHPEAAAVAGQEETGVAVEAVAALKEVLAAVEEDVAAPAEKPPAAVALNDEQPSSRSSQSFLNLSSMQREQVASVTAVVGCDGVVENAVERQEVDAAAAGADAAVAKAAEEEAVVVQAELGASAAMVSVAAAAVDEKEGQPEPSKQRPDAAEGAVSDRKEPKKLADGKTFIHCCVQQLQLASGEQAERGGAAYAVAAVTALGAFATAGAAVVDTTANRVKEDAAPVAAEAEAKAASAAARAVSVAAPSNAQLSDESLQNESALNDLVLEEPTAATPNGRVKIWNSKPKFRCCPSDGCAQWLDLQWFDLGTFLEDNPHCTIYSKFTEIYRNLQKETPEAFECSASKQRTAEKAVAMEAATVQMPALALAAVEAAPEEEAAVQHYGGQEMDQDTVREQANEAVEVAAVEEAPEQEAGQHHHHRHVQESEETVEDVLQFVGLTPNEKLAIGTAVCTSDGDRGTVMGTSNGYYKLELTDKTIMHCRIHRLQLASYDQLEREEENDQEDEEEDDDGAARGEGSGVFHGLTPDDDLEIGTQVVTCDGWRGDPVFENSVGTTRPEPVVSRANGFTDETFTYCRIQQLQLAEAQTKSRHRGARGIDKKLEEGDQVVTAKGKHGTVISRANGYYRLQLADKSYTHSRAQQLLLASGQKEDVPSQQLRRASQPERNNLMNLGHPSARDTQTDSTGKDSFVSLDIKCLICLSEPEPGTEICTLRCGHQYCRGCIEQWWMAAENNTCPACRKVFPSFRGSAYSTISDEPVVRTQEVELPSPRPNKRTRMHNDPPANRRLRGQIRPTSCGRYNHRPKCQCHQGSAACMTPGRLMVPTNRAPVEGEPYAIGTRLTAAYRKHVCEENDSIVSVVEGIEDPLVHRDLLRAQMLAVNRRLLLGPKLRAKSLLKAGTILLIPDAACKLHSTVTKYLGFFDAGDVHSERWEATDGDDLIYKVDASNVYEGMGYSTDPDGAYMGERVVRRFENGGESDGVVVGRMAAGQAADEPAVWLVLHNDGDREDLEKHELEEAIALAKQEVPAAKKQRALPADEEELQLGELKELEGDDDEANEADAKGAASSGQARSECTEAAAAAAVAMAAPVEVALEPLCMPPPVLCGGGFAASRLADPFGWMLATQAMQPGLPMAE